MRGRGNPAHSSQPKRPRTIGKNARHPSERPRPKPLFPLHPSDTPASAAVGREEDLENARELEHQERQRSLRKIPFSWAKDDYMLQDLQTEARGGGQRATLELKKFQEERSCGNGKSHCAKEEAREENPMDQRRSADRQVGFLSQNTLQNQIDHLLSLPSLVELADDSSRSPPRHDQAQNLSVGRDLGKLVRRA